MKQAVTPLLVLGLMAVTSTAGAQQPPPATSAPGTPVSVATVAHADVPVLLSNIGAVQAYQSVLVRARVDGTLDTIFFTEGQSVKVGDKLAQIDPRPYAASLAAAKAKKAADEAQLANAKLDLQRYSNLVRNDFASRQQVDTQMAQVAQLTATLQGDDANIATAQLNLDYTTISSPIDGQVGLRMVDIGNLIHATDSTGIVTITQIQPISVVFTLPQDDFPQIREAMTQGKLPVFAFTSDDQTQLGQGTLLTTDNAMDQTTGTIRLKATFPNQNLKLWPGQFVNVRLQVAVIRNAMTIPSQAVQRGPNGLFVYTVKDGTAAMQPIQVRQDDGTNAVVSRGLDDQTQVVISGQSRLQSGARVTIVAPTKANS